MLVLLLIPFVSSIQKETSHATTSAGSVEKVRYPEPSQSHILGIWGQ